MKRRVEIEWRRREVHAVTFEPDEWQEFCESARIDHTVDPNELSGSEFQRLVETLESYTDERTWQISDDIDEFDVIVNTKAVEQ